VYIGAIYTPGLMDVERVFGVAQVPATLGLTLYVAGYGLGPIIWSPMSEIPQIGRLWVYIGTLCKFVLMSTTKCVANYVCSHIRSVPAAYPLRSELRHAPRLPILDWILRFTSTRNRRRDHRRHVPSAEASIWPRGLGYRSCLWPSARSACRWLRRRSQRLDMDDLGDHVALRLLSHLPLLLPARDERDEYPASTHEAPSQAHRRRSFDLRAGYDV
jgi:hypothetical protein